MLLKQRFGKGRRSAAVWLMTLLILMGCEKGCSRESEHQTADSTPAAKEPGQTLGAETGQQNMQRRTLVFFGDSLTAGYGLNLTEAFPAKVQAKLLAAGLPWKVVNAGVSGDTTRGGLERTDWVLKAKPDTVFLCLGANDGLRGLSVEESKKNLKAIIDAFLAKNVQVLLGGMELPANYGLSYRTEFRQMYVALATEYRLPFLPFLLEGMALKPELTLQDGIHPNAKGTEVIAENVWTFLKSQLQLD